MRPFVPLVAIMSLLMMLAAAQLRCDPETQYEVDGKCCKMCGPGTSMSSFGNCQEPQCQQCGKNEYQSKFTKESKCQRQPYCDPHRNFQPAVHDRKTKSVCLCKEGFHCSDKECITCVSHKTCEQGHGVKSEGNHTHDTVCEKCPEGTFSGENSWKDVCKKWTECEDGHFIEQGGTDTSDNICVKASRTHNVLAIAIPVAIAVLGTVLLFLYFCTGKQGYTKGKVKGCFESCLGGKHEPLREREATGLITPINPVDEESMSPEMVSSQEEGFPRTPVENEDEQSQENSIDGVLTVNGNLVTQENGEADKLSRQESQTQTLQTE